MVFALLSLSNIKLNSLSQWQGRAMVDRAGRAAHVLLPGVAAGFATTTGLFLATEGAADFGAGGADIAINKSTIASSGSYPLEHILQIFSEKRRGQSLWNLVVPLNHLVQGFEFEDVEDWSKYLCLHNFCIVSDFYDCGEDIIPIHIIKSLASIQDLSALLLDLLQSIEIILNSSL